MADLDAGAAGSMTSATLPDLIGPAIATYLAGRRDEAKAIYQRLLPIINLENRQCGWRTCKVVMKEAAIRTEAVRHPTHPLIPRPAAISSNSPATSTPSPSAEAASGRNETEEVGCACRCDWPTGRN